MGDEVNNKKYYATRIDGRYWSFRSEPDLRECRMVQKVRSRPDIMQVFKMKYILGCTDRTDRSRQVLVVDVLSKVLDMSITYHLSK